MKKIILFSIATAIYACSTGQTFAGIYPDCRGFRGICSSNYDYNSCVNTYETSRGSGHNALKGWQCMWDPVDRFTPPCWSTRVEGRKSYRCHAES